jgi:acetolactate synthase-1/2/3 large subunit
MATSGPGATNLLTGIGSCFFDSTPAVFITGQVNRHEQKGDRPIRQLGFQETDIVSMAKPITKSAKMVRDPAELPTLLADAFDLAVQGRPGPTLIDIPMDVQRVEADFPETVAVGVPRPRSVPGVDQFLGRLFSAFEHAQHPLILVGGGVRSGRSTAAFRSLVRRLNIPVVWSLMGVDALPTESPLGVGMIGSYGNRWANLALGHCDVLLVLGSRLDVRQTGSDTESFRSGKQIFHVDCQPGEMNNRVKGCETLTAELADFLAEALPFAEAQPLTASHADWKAQIAAFRLRWPDVDELADVPGINPNRFLRELSLAAPQAIAFVIDVGQHQMWAAQSMRIGADQRFLTSGGMGSMGFALPAAIGVAVTTPGCPVVLVAGDGGFQSNLQELETVRRNSLPIKMTILNNGCHGMVRQFQQSYFEGRYQSTLWGYSAPSFERIAAAYGLPARRVADRTDVADAITWLLADSQQPALLEVAIDTFANAYPKVAFGRPITEMEPFAKPVEMEGT